MGGIPNTASRIEGLNKHLGTRRLASSTAVGDFDELLTRRVGRFRLVGKADAIDVYELLALRDEATPEQRSLANRFGEVLETCEAGHLTAGWLPKCSIKSLKTSRMTDRHGFTWNFAGSTRSQSWQSMTPQ